MDEALKLFNQIGYGRANAVNRPYDKNVDRAFRDMVNKANKSGDCIISGEAGYYRPRLDVEAEVHEANVYINQEANRGRDIMTKVSMMRFALLKKREVLEHDETGEVAI